MEFSVSEAFDAENIIATSAIEGLRLFSVQKNVSATSPAELPDLIDVQTPGGGWVRSSPANVCGDEYVAPRFKQVRCSVFFVCQ